MELRCQTTLERYIRSLFYHIGLFIGTRPVWVLVLTVLAALMCDVGMLRFEPRGDARADYCPDDSQSKFEFAVAQDFFGANDAPYSLSLAAEARDGGSVLRREHTKELIYWENYLASVLQSTTDDRRYSFSDLCGFHCDTNEALRVFLVSYDDIHFGASPRRTANRRIRLTHPVMELFGDRYYLGSNLINVTVDGRTNEVRTAAVVLLSYRAQIDSPLKKRKLADWERQLALALQRHAANTSAHLRLTAASEGLVNAEVNRIGNSTLPYIVLSVLVILLFTIATTLTDSAATSQPWVALGGVGAPLLAIGASFGLLVGVGARYMAMVSVVPFLVVAVGVDDVYLALHAWRQTADGGRMSVAERLAQTLQHAGPSITITSLTNAISFLVGVLATTPAVRTFCLFASVTITIAYVFQLTYFSALLAIDGYREASGRSGFIPCFPASTEPPKSEQNGTVSTDKSRKLSIGSLIYKVSSSVDICSQQLLETLALLYTTVAMRIVTLVFLVIYLTVAGIGVYRMKVELSSDKLFLADSPLSHWAQLEPYLNEESGYMLLFVNDPGDLTNATRLQLVLDLVDGFNRHNNSLGEDSTQFWLRDYLDFFWHSNPRVKQIIFAYTGMSRFLRMSTYSKWKLYMNRGLSGSCSNNTATCVDSFALSTGFRGPRDWTDRMHLLTEWRALAANYSELNCTLLVEWSMYADQLSSIGPSTIKTVLIAIACMTVVCVLFIPNLVGVVCATASVVSINLGVVGVLHWWSVDLDPISMATILMSIGFSVDFTAHTSYHFYRDSGDKTPSCRLQQTLSAVARPSLQAGASTLLAVAVLLMVPAYMQRVFVKTVVLVVALGLMHALWLLPVVLAALPTRTTESKKPAKEVVADCGAIAVATTNLTTEPPPNGVVWWRIAKVKSAVSDSTAGP